MKKTNRTKQKHNGSGQQCRQSRKLWILPVAAAVVLVVLLLAFFIDRRNDKEILKLGNYKGLTYTSVGTDSIATELVNQVIADTTFGGQLKERSEACYQDTIAYYEREAAYFQMELSAYLSKYYQKTLTEFRKEAKETSEQVVKQEMVLDAIADAEGIVLSDADYEQFLKEYLTVYECADEKTLYQKYDETEVRKNMLRDKVLDYLVTHASKKN